MGGLRPYEIIASVVGRPDNHVMRREGFERFFKNRRRQVRTVAVEGNNAALVAHYDWASASVSPRRQP
jgi:hypothetical protein